MKMPSLSRTSKVTAPRTTQAILTLSFGLILTACGGLPTNSTQSSSPTLATNAMSLAVPADIDFGTVGPNSNTMRSLTLRNNGRVQTVLEQADVSPAPTFAVLNFTGPIQLAPSQTIQLQVVFAPTTTANYSGSLILYARPIRAGSMPRGSASPRMEHELGQQYVQVR